MRTLVIASVVVSVGVVGGMAAPVSAERTGKPIVGTTCEEFPADNWWHADVSELPLHGRSEDWLSHMSSDNDVHPDFGGRYGIPITVVKSSHKKVRVTFRYAGESDKVRYPLGKDTRIEGAWSQSGDRHAVVVDKGKCVLYETWHTKFKDGKWRAGGGAVWSLGSNKLRKDGWTSADAAGLPILPGLLRWNEVRDDQIDHAIRFTTDKSSRAHLWPARHDAGSTNNPAYPPMGARFRMKASFDASDLSIEAQRVVAAMKKYGLVLADNGSPWFFQGEQSSQWPDQLLDDLKSIPASAFVAVDTSSLMVSEDSGQVQ